VNFFLILLLTCSFAFAHKECCAHKQRKWSSVLSVAAINTSTEYRPTNHHQGLALDHSGLSLYGPASDYLDVTAALAFHTSKKLSARKITLSFDIDELSLKTTRKLHDSFRVKAGHFASYISPDNQENCCGTYFIKRPILYRAFFGGHLIDKGMHVDYTINHFENSNTIMGVEAFQGKGLMATSNKTIGVFSGMVRHKKHFNQNNVVDISVSSILNTLYNQNNEGIPDHVSCCQGGSYTGNHMVMGNLSFTSPLQENIDCTFSLEAARISKLAKKYGRNNHHMAYNAGPIIAFKELSVGIVEVGVRYDHLRGIGFCPSDGPYFVKTIEKTFMVGWKPSQHHTLRFEYTNQTLKNAKPNNIFQLKYTMSVSLF
jgi:hypothetical protein